MSKTAFTVVSRVSGYGTIKFTAVLNSKRAEDNPIVGFFDTRYRFTEYGQFTGASYYADTFLEIAPKSGLQLYGGVPAWYLSPEAVQEVKDWLKEELSNEAE